MDESLCLDPTLLEERITERTKAIVLVHMRGAPADIHAVLAIARPRGIAVIADTAQTMGATSHGRLLGTIADIGAFSLQYNKVITSGEGGLLATRDQSLYERAVMYHDVGACLRADMSGVAPISTHNPAAVRVGRGRRPRPVAAGPGSGCSRRC